LEQVYYLFGYRAVAAGHLRQKINLANAINGDNLGPQ